MVTCYPQVIQASITSRGCIKEFREIKRLMSTIGAIGIVLLSIAVIVIIIVGSVVISNLTKFAKAIRTVALRVAQCLQNNSQVISCQVPTVMNSTHPLTTPQANSALQTLDLCAALQEGAKIGKSDFFDSHKEWSVVHGTGLPFFAAIGSWPIPSSILIVFRGTSSVSELQNRDFGNSFLLSSDSTPSYVKLLLKEGITLPYPPQVTLDGLPSNVKANAGFISAFSDVQDDIFKTLESFKNVDTVLIGGHSLGSAVAAICAAKISNSLTYTNLSLICTACPKPGNPAFVDFLVSKNIDILNIVNSSDLITASPSSLIPDFLSDSGNIQYQSLPGQYIFSCVASDLLACHSIPVYIQGVKSLSKNYQLHGL